MLAADLAASWDDLSFIPANLVPGDTLDLPILVRNIGNSAAVGRVTVEFYLSTNNVFDTSDTRIARFANQPVSLSANGFPNSEGDFTGQGIDIGNITPGDYFLLVRLVPDGDVADSNQSNNVAVSDDSYNISWRFGAVGSRTDVELTLTDDAGTEVTFGLPGGGTGTVTRDTTNTDRYDVALANTGSSSRLGISATGGSGPTSGIALIDDISTAGSLQSIDGATARLMGDVTIAGTVGSVRFFDVVGPSFISIGGSTVNNVFTFGSVTDLRITTTAKITSLTVTNWTDTEATVDLITAKSIGTLTSTGTGNSGRFEASLRLSGAGGSARTLDTVNIAGQVGEGAWSVNGRAGNWTVASVDNDWSASVKQVLASFTDTGNFRGTLTAKNINAVTIGVNMNSAKILAGAWLGLDGALGGSGDDADTFSAGNITNVNVSGRITQTTIGAGLNPVDGIFGNGNDSLFAGKIQGLVVRQAAGPTARFLARRYLGTITIRNQTVDTTQDRRFALDESIAPTAVFGGEQPSGAPTEIVVTFSDNQRLKRATLGNGDLVVTGPGGFMQVLTFVRIEDSPGLANLTVVYSIAAPGGTWDSAENGEYVVSVAAGQVADVVGNQVAAGEVGRFTVNV